LQIHTKADVRAVPRALHVKTAANVCTAIPVVRVAFVQEVIQHEIQAQTVVHRGSSTKTTQTGTKTTSQGKSVTSKEYFVDPLTISVRKTPGPTGEIICTLKEFDSVTLLKMYDTKWAQIEAICGGIKVIGFTLKSNLIKIEN
jgi:hypothetical protein